MSCQPDSSKAHVNASCAKEKDTFESTSSNVRDAGDAREQEQYRIGCISEQQAYGNDCKNGSCDV